MDRTTEKWSWALIGLSSAAIALTSACYAASANVLALPVPAARIGEALAAANAGAPLLRLGGNLGVPADLLFAAAALVLAMNGRKKHEALGWAMGAVSAVIFTLADGMVAHCLEASAGFPVAKSLFDLLFTAGTLSFGAAMLLIFWPQPRTLVVRLSLAVGALASISSMAVLWGADAGRMLGLSIGSGVVLLVVSAVRRWRELTPSPDVLVARES